ncbi:MAG TPA: 5-oxoprolinase subunit PxpA [Longimicrobiales bacterium]|nr:5-oxoprolinase subunit PxpA [Longimicrobiales bacterium]
MTRIDLNCDMGESFGAYRIGADDAVLPHVTSANIACGFHGGDPAVMGRTVAAALRHGVAVGAHPGLPDLVGFGRRAMEITPEEAYDLVVYQVGALLGFTAAAGAAMQHVKPHGALYNMAAGDAALADAIAAAVRDVDRGLVLFGLAGSELVAAGERAGLRTASEAFADRAYTSDGALVPRRREGALVTDAEEAVRRALGMVVDGRVRAIDGADVPLRADTICIHGDGAHAAEFARRLRAAFEAAGVTVAPVGRAAAPAAAPEA